MLVPSFASEWLPGGWAIGPEHNQNGATETSNLEQLLSAIAAHSPVATKHYAGCVDFYEINFGAVDGKDLEPFSAPELLDELEDWSAQITSDPALSQAIAEAESHDGELVTTPHPKGPTP